MVEEVLKMIVEDTGETVKDFLLLIGKYRDDITLDELNDIFTKYKIRRLIMQ